MIGITTFHMALFATLVDKQRVSIRSNNEHISYWQQLQQLGVCSILESGRTDTVVIHLTKRGERAAADMLLQLEGRIF